MRRAYKFRLYPSVNQVRELCVALETHRRLYNACLERRKSSYEKDKTSLSYSDQSAWFTGERKTNKWFEKLNFSSAQATMRRLEKAFQSFFRRIKAKKDKPGFPRFRGADRYDSIEFPSYGDGIKLMPDGKLRVQHIGKIKVKQHREIKGTIKTVTLKRESDKWFAVFSCDLGEVTVPKSANPPIGIDVGLEHYRAATFAGDLNRLRSLTHSLSADPSSHRRIFFRVGESVFNRFVGELENSHLLPARECFPPNCRLIFCSFWATFAELIAWLEAQVNLQIFNTFAMPESIDQRLRICQSIFFYKFTM
jgi:transposase